MSRTFALVPNFSTPLTVPDHERVPFHADPILAAIERHSEAWSVFQVAPEGEASERADDETFASLHALLATPCATRAGMLCLIRHLRWWLAEEAVNADAHRTEGGADAWAIAEVREAELSRCLGVDPIQRIPAALPSGRLAVPALIPPNPCSLAAGRDTPSRFLAIGEAIGALTLVAGGCLLTGLATLI